jgi:NTP pyrophosphatase (non-canonical NTP hydrolase)
MNIQNLVDFLKTIRKKFRTTIYKGKTQDTIVLLQSIKVSEELGELHNEILKLFQYQRKEKMSDSSVNIEKELTDVILSVMLLGIELDIDIEKALIEKMKIIKKRHA